MTMTLQILRIIKSVGTECEVTTPFIMIMIIMTMIMMIMTIIMMIKKKKIMNRVVPKLD